MERFFIGKNCFSPRDIQLDSSSLHHHETACESIWDSSSYSCYLQPCNQTAWCDRFVTPRSLLGHHHRLMQFFRPFPRHPLKEVDDFWDRRLQYHRRYFMTLGDAFSLDQSKLEKPWKQLMEGEGIQPWPCVPRTKKFMSTADSILDLPHYRQAIFPELLDWSSKNILVAALGRNYYKWAWNSQDEVSRGVTLADVHICKFDPTGELLALGTGEIGGIGSGCIHIHDTETNKPIMACLCMCWIIHHQDCCITALDWSPTGNSFVTGCSKGVVMSVSRSGQQIRWRRICRQAIVTARISPDARYVAATVAGQQVFVLAWNNLRCYSTLYYDLAVRAIAWHPWRSALLGVAGVTYDKHTAIAMWDAAPGRTRYSMASQIPCNVDAMLFSHRTGEMVLSLWNSASKNGSRIVVLSNPETVVDECGEGKNILERVRTMVFSPDGTKLATATIDEDLIIWNFLPEDSNKRAFMKKRFSTLPSCLDEAMFGYSLR